MEVVLERILKQARIFKKTKTITNKSVNIAPLTPVEAAEHRKRRGKQASIVRTSVSRLSFTRASYASARADEKRREPVGRRNPGADFLVTFLSAQKSNSPAGRDRQRSLQNIKIGKAMKRLIAKLLYAFARNQWCTVCHIAILRTLHQRVIHQHQRQHRFGDWCGA